MVNVMAIKNNRLEVYEIFCEAVLTVNASRMILLIGRKSKENIKAITGLFAREGKRI
ncbi:hypothetical protein SAMN05421881_10723 [Nitrosomonas halophila]|uniref:Uncharacterized protein n=1 Tax=Nitrosomonas halophila TaxID=44576 RepID=A0A1H3NDU5_9PROT|nr:hypothetical protein SAMN05421881_10723 [Nitrosomonas halophila]